MTTAYVVYRNQTIDFDMAPMHFGIFSTRALAEAAIVTLNQMVAEDKIYCLDQSPNAFKIDEVPMDQILAS